jgi:ferric-dicitrate binding protein FerR (iron transport regulator)
MFRHSTLTRTIGTLLIAAGLVVCGVPLLRAQDSSARVIYQVGQVSLMNSGLPEVLSVGSMVKAQQMIVTGPDGFAKLEVVSDGSTFEVYPNSKVIFRQTPGSWEHLLNVWLGRVKVYIQHAPGMPNPNNVTSPTAVISVRGTVFDVVVQDDDGTTFVSVDEGLVMVRNLTAPGNSVALHPGESITVFRGTQLLAKQSNHDDLVRSIMQAVRNTVYGMPRTPGGGPAGIPTGTGSGGAQGDKGKGGGSTPGSPPTPGSSPTPGTPSSPGAPPSPGG